jgi:FkbM family methyltransferase
MSYTTILLENAVGKFYVPEIAKDPIFKVLSAGDVYQKPIVDEFASLVRAGSVAIDMGANFGQMSVALAKLGAKVYAFEADEFLASVAQQNLELNGITNSVVINSAIWDVSDVLLPFPEANFDKFDSLGSFGIDLSSTSGRMVKSIALDDLGLEDVSLIKVDVQGADLRAMWGSVDTIKRCRPAIIFEYERLFDADFNVTSRDYQEFIDHIGYKRTKQICNDNYLIVPPF